MRNISIIKTLLTLSMILSFSLPSFAQAEVISKAIAGAVKGAVEGATGDEVGTTTVTPDAEWAKKMNENYSKIEDMYRRTDALARSFETYLGGGTSESLMFSIAGQQTAIPELTELVATYSKYKNTHQMIAQQYRDLFTRDLTGYTDAMNRLNNLNYLASDALNDFNFIKAFILSPNKMTYKERVDLLRYYTDRLKGKQARLLTEYQTYRDSLRNVEASKAFKKALGSSKDVTKEDGNLYELLAKSKDDYKKAADDAIDESSGDIAKATDEMKKAGTPATRFGTLLILILTVMYIPYNMWRVSSGERQSTDAFFRIVIGVLVGLLSMILIEAITK